MCLGSATEIEGSVPWELASGADRPEGLLNLRTTRGCLRVAASTAGSADGRRLTWVSVAEKQVDYGGRFEAPSTVRSEVQSTQCAAPSVRPSGAFSEASRALALRPANQIEPS